MEKTTNKTEVSRIDYSNMNGNTTHKDVEYHTTGKTISEEEKRMLDAMMDLDRDKIDVVEKCYDVKKDGSRGKFHHDAMGEWMIKKYNICSIGNALYIYDKVHGVYNAGPYDVERKISDLIPGLTMHQRAEVEAYMRLHAPIRIPTETDARYIAFRNGILDISKNVMVEPSPDRIIFNLIPHNYNPDAYSEAVDTMYDTLSCYRLDVRKQLEEMTGFIMYRRNQYRRSYMLKGDKNNGKSTIINSLITMVGRENCQTLSLEDIVSNKFMRADLDHKLFNAGDDIDSSFVKNTSILRKIISGDPIQVERKQKQPFTLYPYVKIVFSANEIPRMDDATGAVLDRIEIIPLDYDYTKSDKFEREFIDQIRSEEAMEYMIAMGIAALQEILFTGSFSSSKSADETKSEYEKENSAGALIEWLDSKADRDIVYASINKIYSVDYVTYARSVGKVPVSQAKFTRAVNKKFGTKSMPKTFKNQMGATWTERAFVKAKN